MNDCRAVSVRFCFFKLKIPKKLSIYGFKSVSLRKVSRNKEDI